MRLEDLAIGLTLAMACCACGSVRGIDSSLIVDATVEGGEPGLDGGALESSGPCACQPDWCGCGDCQPSTIVCTKNPVDCARGCRSSCPALDTTKCACVQDRCVHNPIEPMAACYDDRDCPPSQCCNLQGATGVCERCFR